MLHTPTHMLHTPTHTLHSTLTSSSLASAMLSNPSPTSVRACPNCESPRSFLVRVSPSDRSAWGYVEPFLMLNLRRASENWGIVVKPKIDVCVCTCTCVYVCMCVCIYVCIYIYMYVCMYVCLLGLGWRNSFVLLSMFVMTVAVASVSCIYVCVSVNVL